MSCLLRPFLALPFIFSFSALCTASRVRFWHLADFYRRPLRLSAFGGKADAEQAIELNICVACIQEFGLALRQAAALS